MESLYERHATYQVIGSYYCNTSVPGTSYVYTGVPIAFKFDTDFIHYRCMPAPYRARYSNESHYNSTPVTYGNYVIYSTFRDNRNNEAAICALCRIDGRDTTVIQPATYDCPNGWTKEYEGYLMSGGLCVHTEMATWGEVAPLPSHNDSYIHHEVINLYLTSYSGDKVLSCVVCSI